MALTPYNHMSWDSDRQPVQVARVRAATLFFTLTVMLTISAFRSQDVVSPALSVGLSCLVLATLLSGTAAFRRFDQPTMLAIGALDLVAVLALGSLPGAAVTGALVVVPGVWLGGIFRLRGVALATLMGAVAIGLAEFLSRSSDMEIVGRMSWIVTVGVIAAVAMASIINVWVGQVERLEAHQSALAAALSALEEEQKRTTAIVHTVDVGLATVRADGSFTALNPRVTELMALAFPSGQSGQAGQLGEIYAADNQTLIEHSRLPSMRAMAGEAFTDTLWIGDQPEARRAVAVSCRPIRDPDGGFAGAVIAYHDVTALMRAMRVKDDFVAMVSHELRTPLTSIIGNLEVAAELDHDTADQLPQLLAVASRNADRLLHLISDLLTVSQPRLGSMPVLPEAVDLSALVEQSVGEVSDLAKGRMVELKTEIGPGLRLIGDRGQLLQVTENLLSNAVKFTPPGGHVRVTLCQTAADTLLLVQDTGIGVSEADQKELFARFHRGRNAQDLNLPGAGLGLAITKEIVEAHGGSIQLASGEGKGTTVLVTLPSGAGPATA